MTGHGETTSQLVCPFPPLTDRLDHLVFPKYVEFVTACCAASWSDAQIAQAIGPGVTKARLRIMRERWGIASGWRPSPPAATRAPVEMLGDTIEAIIAEQRETKRRETERAVAGQGKGGRARPEGSASFCRVCDAEATIDRSGRAEQHPSPRTSFDPVRRIHMFTTCPGSGRSAAWKVPAGQAVAA